jgi:hypothetical protein
MAKERVPQWQIGLKDREIEFVIAYRENHFNGTRAMMALGVKGTSARQAAYDMRNKSRVASAIAMMISEDPSHLRSRLIEVLNEQINSDPLLAYELDEDGRIVLTDGKPTLRKDLRPEHLAGVTEVSIGKKRTRFKFADKQGAARILARHVGLAQEAPAAPVDDAKALTPDVELARAIAFLLTRAAKSQGAP